MMSTTVVDLALIWISTLVYPLILSPTPCFSRGPRVAYACQADADSQARTSSTRCLDASQAPGVGRETSKLPQGPFRLSLFVRQEALVLLAKVRHFHSLAFESRGDAPSSPTSSPRAMVQLGGRYRTIMSVVEFLLHSASSFV